ncbi:MAG: hypothetical protein ACO25K_05675 [Candidatus Fonsibacter ubiquis]
MMKFNLYGNSFTHRTGGNLGYSTHGKKSKFIEWVFDNSSDISFYVDNSISDAFFSNDKKKKYGWLLESKFITFEIYSDVKNNYEKYFEVFDLIFTNSKELLSIDSRFKWCPAASTWIQTPKIYQKNKIISFISSGKTITEGHKLRRKWVDMIGDQVDLYGRDSNWIEYKEQGLCDYMFSVVIENGFYDGYFTEKILDCLPTGTEHIYKGEPNIGEYFNPDGIINLSEEFDVSEIIYYNMIDAIKENFFLLEKYPIGEDYIFTNYFL